MQPEQICHFIKTSTLNEISMSVPSLFHIRKITTKSRKRTNKWQIEWLTRGWHQALNRAFRNCANCSSRGLTHRKAAANLSSPDTSSQSRPHNPLPVAHVHPSIHPLGVSFNLLPRNLRYLFQLPQHFTPVYLSISQDKNTLTSIWNSDRPTDRFCSRTISRTEPTRGKTSSLRILNGVEDVAWHMLYQVIFCRSANVL